MTDWERMTEEIRRAMEAVDSAQKASEALQSNANGETLDAFHREVRRLQEELKSLDWVLKHPGSIQMDELALQVREWLEGKHEGYRRAPKVEAEKKRQ